MNWPKKIPVNTLRIPIRFVPPKTIGGGRTDGEFRNTEGAPEINIADNIVGEYKDHVVCHEILHAWIHTNGLQQVLSNDLEERIADTFSHELMRLLKKLRLCDVR